jgi:hypothetical protein
MPSSVSGVSVKRKPHSILPLRLEQKTLLPELRNPLISTTLFSFSTAQAFENSIGVAGADGVQAASIVHTRDKANSA